MPSRDEPRATPGFVLVPELGPSGDRLALDDAESRYVARVCRARLGELVALTDGRGARAVARVRALRPRVEVEIERCERSTPIRTAVLLCGPPEGSRADWLVEKIAELGIGAFHPVDCARGRWEAGAARIERWRKLVGAALRQSRGCWRMAIEPVRSLAEALEAAGPGSRLWIADMDGTPAGRVPPAPEGPTLGLVGPAAGFDSEERIRLAARGAEAIRLAGKRLRTETAAVAWAAWWAGGEAADGETGEDGQERAGGLDDYKGHAIDC
jgi:16S rRNA (uracil1498-N3)-methyltransferase